MLRNKKIFTIITGILLVAIIGTTIGLSFAFWINNPQVDDTQNIPVAPFNPSAVGQVFNAIDADGYIILDILDISDVVSFALVGYVGLFDVLLTLTGVRFNGEDFYVTHILHRTQNAPLFMVTEPIENEPLLGIISVVTEPSILNYNVSFMHNEIIRYIATSIPQTNWANHVFFNMPNLNTVYILDGN